MLNNLSETAYCVRNGEVFELRWFTPTVEVDLCGHATLATAWALFEQFGEARDVLRFISGQGHSTCAVRSLYEVPLRVVG